MLEDWGKAQNEKNKAAENGGAIGFDPEDIMNIFDEFDKDGSGERAFSS